MWRGCGALGDREPGTDLRGDPAASRVRTSSGAVTGYLLTLFSCQRCGMVQVSPTVKLQAVNAMSRLETVLNANLLIKDRWKKHHGHVYQVEGATDVSIGIAHV